MSSAEAIVVQKRLASGTSATRAVRAQGSVPGIIYGGDKKPEMIAVDPKVLIKEMYRPGFFSRLFTLSVDGKKESVLAKDIQLHPVSDHPLHVDFQRVSKTSKIHVSIPLTVINEDRSPGVKRGGVVNLIRHTLEVISPATEIPDGIEIDLAGLDAGISILITQLNLPKNVVPANPERDHTILTIVPPAGPDKGAASDEEEGTAE